MRFMENLKPVSLLLLRLALGGIFMYHGYAKLFTNHGADAATFVRWGFPSYFATISGSLEFFGGILLVIGLLTRVAALLLAIEMGVGLARVTIPQSGIYAVTRYELPVMLFVAAFALATVGAGAISIDRVTFEGSGSPVKKSKPAK
jgi:putative oxidoreductase